MRLSDINGLRGGAYKCCHLRVVLPGLFDVVVKDTEADLYVAIDRAADRAQRTVMCRIERQQTLLRRPFARTGRAEVYTQLTNQTEVRGTFGGFHATDTSRQVTTAQRHHVARAH